MRKKSILLTLLFAPLSLGLFAEEKPNILWIVADDLGLELGCYGDEDSKTPNIDRLASESVIFRNAYATAPVCSASRTAFITGMFQTTTGGHHHDTRLKEPLASPFRPVTDYFREAGYWVSILGAKDWESWGKTHYNFIFDVKEMYDAPDWSGRAEGQPFFAQVQIKEPHRTFVLSGRSGEGLTIPPFFPEHPVIRADWANYLATIEVLDEKVGLVLDRLEKEGELENTIIFFFGDHGRPHVRGKQWLYEEGLRVPLMVRFPGMPEPGREDDRLVSLIDLVPTMLAASGLEVPEHLQGQDLFSENWKDRDAIFAARDRCGDAWDRIRSVRTEDFKLIRNFHPERSFSQHSGYKKAGYPALTVMAVMHEQGRLSGRQEEWFGDTRPEYELYDLKKDPNELNNLADDPEYAAKLQELNGRIDQWMEETGDRGGEQEGDEALAKMIKEEKWLSFEKRMKSRCLSGSSTNREYLNWWKKELGVE